jgi:tRNA (guanine10-N2)-dimethyltransferase
VPNLFLLLSGEHEALPVSEAKAILEAEGYMYEVSENLEQVLRLKADRACANVLKQRAAFTRMCALELFSCEAKLPSIIKSVQSTDWQAVLSEDESFAVRVKHIKEYSRRINGMTLEGKLGALIADKCPRAEVRLQNPDKAFVGVLTSGRFVFGMKLAEIPAKPFVERRPRKKPFFHPSAMTAKLARCMVNLAEPKAGEVVLDPFCGTGTMIIEARLIGCRVLGMDIQRRMARGTRRNMAHFNIKSDGIIVGDADHLPVTGVDRVVTDPPYGISSTTLKRTTEQLVKQVLKSVHGTLPTGKRICLAAPKKLGIIPIGKVLGFKPLESHFVYVHRSLTREIVVFKKV